jgi:SAM-dependent methyltransferase
MRRGFEKALRCPGCGTLELSLRVRQEDDREVREGSLRCGGCAREYAIEKGIVTTLDLTDEALAREVNGWHQLAGPLGEGLVSTMTALPYYPHAPWPQLAPDFFQLFEHLDFADKNVVDLGAGRAWSSRHIATLGRAREVVAVDVLTRRFLGLETADVFYAEDRRHFERICGDIHRVPLRDGWADVVFGAAAIHHSGQRERLFAEVWRLLKPGGAFAFIAEPSKKASIPERQPQNEETAVGINEHIYSFAEYMGPLRAQGFRPRHLAPRSIRYRMLYPDPDFMEGLTPTLRRLSRSALGRRLVTRLVRGRWTGPLVYRYASLPLSVIALKPGPPPVG